MKLLEKLLKSGWRIALGWTFVSIMAAIIYVVVSTKSLPSLADTAILITAFSPLIVARSFDKHKGCA